MACSGGAGLAGQTTTDRLARGRSPTLDWTTLSFSSDPTVNRVGTTKNPKQVHYNPNTLSREYCPSSSPSCRLTRTRSLTPSLQSTRPVLANYHPPYPSNLNTTTNISNRSEYLTTLRPPQNQLRNLSSVPSLPVRGIESSENECSVTLRAFYLHHQ